MHEQHSSVALPQLTCSDLVYRSIITDYWVNRKTGKIKPAAFRRRPADAKGLSVNIAANYSIQQCIESPHYNECFAVGSLHVGCIRDLGLEVVPDTADHANIVGVPLEGEDDKRREDLAQALAEQCRPLWLSLKVRPG